MTFVTIKYYFCNSRTFSIFTPVTANIISYIAYYQCVVGIKFVYICFVFIVPFLNITHVTINYERSHKKNNRL